MRGSRDVVSLESSDRHLKGFGEVDSEDTEGVTKLYGFWSLTRRGAGLYCGGKDFSDSRTRLRVGCTPRS